MRRIYSRKAVIHKAIFAKLSELYSKKRTLAEEIQKTSCILTLGVVKYNVEKTPKMKPSPAGTISFGAENATFFYQEKEFVSGRDIYYIDTTHLTKHACLFLITCLQTIVDKYSYSYGMFPDLVKKEEIKLPTKDDGKPDWEYMGNYMKKVMSDCESKLDNLELSV